jgi:hypothetical protein
MQRRISNNSMIMYPCCVGKHTKNKFQKKEHKKKKIIMNGRRRRKGS